MARKHYEWKVRDKVLQLGPRTLIVGVLNITPDSFSDGGKYEDPDRAFARAIELEEQGADIIDIGAESTRPGSHRISEAEELRRLVPVLKRLRNKLTVPISVDTYKSGVAEKALELGVDIINDPSGLTFDTELASKAVQGDAGVILNHMRGTPESWAKLPPLSNPVATIAAELDACVHRAVRAGVDRKRIVIDPGLGFGKRKEQNSEILACLDEMARLEIPIMVGPSRKQFIAKETLLETDFATAAAVVAAILHGAHMVRVHDVKMMKAVVETADEIANIRQQIHQVRADAEAEAKAAAKALRGPREQKTDGFRKAEPMRSEGSAETRRLQFPRPTVVPVAAPVIAPVEAPIAAAPFASASAEPQAETVAESAASEAFELTTPDVERAPAADKPAGFRPFRGRTFGDRQEGERPRGPRDGAPRYDSPRPGGGRTGGFRRSDGPGGDRGPRGRDEGDGRRGPGGRSGPGGRGGAGGRSGAGGRGDDRRPPSRGGFRGPRDGGPGDRGPRDGGPRDRGPRDGGPRGGRPSGGDRRPSGPRPGGSRPGGSRPGGGRPSGGRPGGPRPGGSRSGGPRPSGPRFGRKDGDSSGRPPRSFRDRPKDE